MMLESILWDGGVDPGARPRILERGGYGDAR